MFKYLSISLILSPLLLANTVILNDKSSEKELTVYNADLALIKETKDFNVEGNDFTKIQFPNVAQRIITDSVLLKFKKPVTVQTEDYEYDLVSFNKLLEQKIGEEVFFKELISGNGSSSIEYKNSSGVLLSVSPLLIKLNNGEIVANINTRDIFFKKMSKDLILKPSLVWNVNPMEKGENSLKLMYLSNGISWNSNYVLNFNEEKETIDFNGKIKVNNNSGIKYENITLKLIAGDVNVKQEPQYERRLMAKAVMMDSMVAESNFGTVEAKEQSFGDYHLYTVPFQVTLKNNQTKQISIFNKEDIKVEKLYEIISDNMFNSYSNPNQIFKNFISYLKIENKEENGMGLPLPMGKIRMYQTTGVETHFIGEDNIKHTPKNEEIKLKIGNAFDLTMKENVLKSKNQNYSNYSEQMTKKSYLIKNNSEKNKKLTVIVNKYVTDEFDLETNCNEDRRCEYKEENNQFHFTVNLKPNTEFNLVNRYTNKIMRNK